MLRFIIYLLFFYLVYVFLKKTLFKSDKVGKKIKNKEKHESSFNIDRNNIEDAKFKDVKDEN